MTVPRLAALKLTGKEVHDHHSSEDKRSALNFMLYPNNKRKGENKTKYRNLAID